VLDVPAGWPIPAFEKHDTPKHTPAEARPVTWESVIGRRGDDGSGGYITGSTESRQFPILRGPKAGIWSVAVGTRHLERAHERCVAAGIPCSEMLLVDWTEKDGVRAFFAEVGGILFELMRVEPKQGPPPAARPLEAPAAPAPRDP